MNYSGPQYPVPPKNRSQLRLALGRIYYTWCRYLEWIFPGKQYAGTIQTENNLPNSVIAHKTPLLRQLRNVDMQLQYNKINNLNLAGSRINGLVLKPGETFSFWRLVGKPTRRKGYLEGCHSFLQLYRSANKK
jgi:vancomycin resistance protein VanW